MRPRFRRRGHQPVATSLPSGCWGAGLRVKKVATETFGTLKWSVVDGPSGLCTPPPSGKRGTFTRAFTCQVAIDGVILFILEARLFLVRFKRSGKGDCPPKFKGTVPFSRSNLSGEVTSMRKAISL